MKAELKLDLKYWGRGISRLAGVDEAGRGPLAGPVVAAAVILPMGWESPVPLDDSKKMTHQARERAFPVIRQQALAWAAAVAGPQEIDRVNILQASLGAMGVAVKRLRHPPDYVLVDGNKKPLGLPGDMPWEAVVGGDGLSQSIAAASVLAKVIRDRIMEAYDRRYPQWGFARHKGYPTAEHRRAVQRHGPSPIHRKSFRVK